MTNYLPHAAPFRLRGGSSSDYDDSENSGMSINVFLKPPEFHLADESDEPDSDSVGSSSKRKRKSVQPPKPRKRLSKGKGKASDDESDSETAIRVTLGGKNGAKGMFVDEESHLSDAPEFWDVPAHRVAIILDVSDTPECLQGDRKLMSIDAYIKKQVLFHKIHPVLSDNYCSQCQDAWTGPTGSKKAGLALVTILDEGKVIRCRRSNLKCNGFLYLLHGLAGPPPRIRTPGCRVRYCYPGTYFWAYICIQECRGH